MLENHRHVLPNGRLDRERSEREMRREQARQVKRVAAALLRLLRRVSAGPQVLKWIAPR
jgi:hypothetical protein